MGSDVAACSACCDHGSRCCWGLLRRPRLTSRRLPAGSDLPVACGAGCLRGRPVRLGDERPGDLGRQRHAARRAPDDRQGHAQLGRVQCRRRQLGELPAARRELARDQQDLPELAEPDLRQPDGERPDLPDQQERHPVRPGLAGERAGPGRLEPRHHRRGGAERHPQSEASAAGQAGVRGRRPRLRAGRERPGRDRRGGTTSPGEGRRRAGRDAQGREGRPHRALRAEGRERRDDRESGRPGAARRRPEGLSAGERRPGSPRACSSRWMPAARSGTTSPATSRATGAT